MTTGTGSAAQWRPGELLDILRADLQARAEPQFALKSMVSQFLAVPGLRGLWTLSNPDNSGNCNDLSGNAHDFIYNGDPVYDYDNLIPCIKMDGVGDYLSVADNADHDITGTETIVNDLGLTIGGWYNIRAASGSEQALLGKYNTNAVNQRSYLIYKLNTNVFRFRVSSNGTLTTDIDSTATYTRNGWHFVAGRFTPLQELALFLDGTWYTNTTSIPASVFNSTASLVLGAYDEGITSNAAAWFSMQFLSCMAVGSAIIEQLWEQTRVAFNRL